MKNSSEAQQVQDTLGDAAAQAVWAANHQDDDLASHYVKAAVVWALDLFCSLGFDQDLSSPDWQTLHFQLEKAKREVVAEHRDWVERWKDYCSRPF